jgi:hypothetical protein
MGERELETGLEKLLDVRTADVVGLLNLNHAKDLRHHDSVKLRESVMKIFWRTWIERKRARWRAAMSW